MVLKKITFQSESLNHGVNYGRGLCRGGGYWDGSGFGRGDSSGEGEGDGIGNGAGRIKLKSWLINQFEVFQ